ncbi:hypothetical protein [Apibacter adventoris]|uniref:hypothetical protein n=1 Tax=Apibacter adventoris TaxID=1679466 RepID=UPI001C870091|nr:hypothetical protein [Apibacter adventoris]
MLCSVSSGCSKERISEDIQRLLLNKDHYAYFEEPYHGKNNSDYVNGTGSAVQARIKNSKPMEGESAKGMKNMKRSSIIIMQIIWEVAVILLT